MNLLAHLLVVASGLFLLGLAATCAFRREAAERFLRRFASSARAHYTEQLARLAGGTALVISAPAMWTPTLFLWFGWVIVITAVALLLTPWQWHHRYGELVIPPAIRHRKLLAAGSLALGAWILVGISRVWLG